MSFLIFLVVGEKVFISNIHKTDGRLIHYVQLSAVDACSHRKWISQRKSVAFFEALLTQKVKLKTQTNLLRKIGKEILNVEYEIISLL